MVPVPQERSKQFLWFATRGIAIHGFFIVIADLIVTQWFFTTPSAYLEIRYPWHVVHNLSTVVKQLQSVWPSHVFPSSTVHVLDAFLSYSNFVYQHPIYVAADAYRLQTAIFHELHDVHYVLMECNITVSNLVRVFVVFYSCLGHMMCVYIRSFHPRGIPPMRYTSYASVVSTAIYGFVNLVLPVV